MKNITDELAEQLVVGSIAGWTWDTGWIDVAGDDIISWLGCSVKTKLERMEKEKSRLVVAGDDIISWLGYSVKTKLEGLEKEKSRLEGENAEVSGDLNTVISRKAFHTASVYAESLSSIALAAAQVQRETIEWNDMAEELIDVDERCSREHRSVAAEEATELCAKYIATVMYLTRFN